MRTGAATQVLAINQRFPNADDEPEINYTTAWGALPYSTQQQLTVNGFPTPAATDNINFEFYTDGSSIDIATGLWNTEITTGDSYEFTGGNSKEVVSGNSVELINGNSTETVNGDSTETINGNSTETINGTSTETVNGDSFEYLYGLFNIAVSTGITLEYSTSLTELIFCYF
ncbi:hypothetical protein RP726_13030 [Candidatus Methylospira mobilis]|uniref:bacteriophage T4 gp5 trimerisation domain-containing protein n=1 Tax=Candidatus Methylospira mobilis TaxID=1808979 RepID=UPI0028F17379|nr:hypothetical protein [Candidatus Methylospira mobilis]WNV03378.1 hypothetical protein RP726_13030 [Candidatus Methylospira mobilis]